MRRWRGMAAGDADADAHDAAAADDVRGRRLQRMQGAGVPDRAGRQVHLRGVPAAQRLLHHVIHQIVKPQSMTPGRVHVHASCMHGWFSTHILSACDFFFVAIIVSGLTCRSFHALLLFIFLVSICMCSKQDRHLCHAHFAAAPLYYTVYSKELTASSLF